MHLRVEIVGNNREVRQVEAGKHVLHCFTRIRDGGGLLYLWPQLIVDALPVSAVQALVPMCVADCGPDVFKGVQVLLAVDGRKGCAPQSRDCKENTEEAQP